MTVFSLRRHHRNRLIVIVAVVCFGLYWLLSGFFKDDTKESWRELGRLKTLRKGLELKDYKFFLDNKETRILSGAMHYFRIVPEYWLDRLQRLKAAGLNTVET